METQVLRVRTYLASSPIQGTGLFLAQPVKAGTVLWAFDEGFDPFVTIEQARLMAAHSPATAEYVKKFGYEDIWRPGYITFNIDNERFKNDSTEPNCLVGKNGESIGAIDLREGQELTNDYEDFLIDSEFGISISWRARRKL
jgi:SET domain-containing protein